MSEGYYKDITKTDVNTKARYNYAEWCSPKGSGMIPIAYRVPGAAVFWGDTAATIHHVAYLVEPVKKGHPEGDWYLVEARSVLLGVCKTKLLSRKPNFWGLMTKYFDYTEKIPEPEPSDDGCPYPRPMESVKKGMKGDNVRWVQWHLWMLNSDSLPKYGVDGSFGKETYNAVKAYQKANGLKVDGIAGKRTNTMLYNQVYELMHFNEETEIDPNAVDVEEDDGISEDDGEAERFDGHYVNSEGFLGMTPEEAAEVVAELARAEKEDT